MKIYSWNVNGIRAIQKKGFIDWIQKEQPDILCLQETKAHVDQLDEALIEIPGYKVFFNAAERKGYSGTAIYYRIEPLAIWTGFEEDRFNAEGRIIVMDYDDFVLLNLYFPNGQRDDERFRFKMDFCDALLDYTNELIGSGKKIIISGDFNTAHEEIDLKHPKNNETKSGFLPIERAWMDQLIESGFVDTYRHLYPEKIEYTWWNYKFNARKTNAGWRIDYHFVTENLKPHLKDAKIHGDIMGSDHCPISIEIDL